MEPEFYKCMMSSVSVSACLCVVFCMVSCAREPEMTVPSNSSQALLDALKDHTSAIVLGSSAGPQVVLAPDFSARVLGASIKGASDENLMWVNPSILDGTLWKTKPYSWNAGGLRTWLAPEDLFFVDEKKNPESWFVPPQLDPVTYSQLDRTELKATFEADIDLPSNIGKIYNVTLRRTITLLKDPPEEIGALQPGVEYMGIEKTHSVTNRSEEVIGKDLPAICLWSLLQVNPAGTMLIPLRENAKPETAYREYFNPLGDRLVVQGNIISVKIDGKYRSKIGVRPEAAGRGIAFLRDNGDGTGILFAKLFYIDPNGTYVDKPWGKESPYGDAIEMYNDSGDAGGFCELEAHGPAQILRNGDTQTHTVRLHIFRGKIADLKDIGSKLYGVDFAGAYYF